MRRFFYEAPAEIMRNYTTNNSHNMKFLETGWMFV
jgi:hypothetical protein